MVTFSLWLNAFIFTQIIEIPIYAMAFPKRPLWQKCLIGFGATAITHPILWTAFPWETMDRNTLMIVGESFVVITEACYLMLFRQKPVDAFLWAFSANAMSAGLGELSRYFFNWP